MRNLICLLLIVLTFALLPVAVEAAPFQNGSFEIEDTSITIITLYPPSTYITGWEVFNNNIELVKTNYVPLWAAKDGFYSPDLNAIYTDGGIRQIFDTVADQDYRVTFWLSGNPYSGPNYTLRVSAAGETQDFLLTYPTGESMANNWNEYTFDFTADSSSTTLSFLNVSNGYSSQSGGPSVDLVSVELLTQPIPEPATILLIGSGLVGLAGLRREKFKK